MANKKPDAAPTASGSFSHGRLGPLTGRLDRTRQFKRDNARMMPLAVASVKGSSRRESYDHPTFSRSGGVSLGLH